MNLRKVFNLKSKSLVHNGFEISFGKYALKSIVHGILNSKQIESGRKVISKYIKNNGKMWIRIFPDIPITKKSPELRMGNGSGDFKFFVFFIKPGKIIYEVSSDVLKNLAKKALILSSYKLPLKTVFIYN